MSSKFYLNSGVRKSDRERELWLLNTETLYLEWKRSRLSKREYIKRNRDYLDSVIEGVLEQAYKRSRV